MSDEKVITVKNQAEYDAALAAAKGAVALEFVMDGCEACEEQMPRIDDLSKTCDGLTVIRANVDDLGDLADKFKCDATPTIYYAKSAAELVPEKAVELEDSAALKRKMKCARSKP